MTAIALQNARSHVLRSLLRRELGAPRSFSQITEAATNHETGLEKEETSDVSIGSNPFPPPVRSSSMSTILPLNQFSTSIYSVPVLLFLRLFYQATPFAISTPENIGRVITSDHGVSCVVIATVPSLAKPPSESFFDTFKQYNTRDFIARLKSDVDFFSRVQIKSITWVKALASPLSHEYLQFLVQDPSTGKLHRLVVDRSDAGDLVTVGWDWKSGKYASHHHVLPLPLLTLFFEGKHQIEAPSLLQFAEILNETSQTQRYRLWREMCWWYAEMVFCQTAKKFPAFTIKQWHFAQLRYSFIVISDWLQRPLLSKAAHEFRIMNINEMRY
ncbi:hypothetical protein H2198_000198 [Neophaeococcomyces mojaviensis]|uniref:Uncharacterized protein n=1 Tax=Neophaeococcomyces mojaviensis TaxID=3383035 RepID=A0ACC3AL70_9EURO|nr:hypothetical protein H2198_000198 [Knufia sp. JES_112]